MKSFNRYTNFTFGMFKGHDVGIAYIIDPQYIKWCILNIPDFYLEDLIELENINVYDAKLKEKLGDAFYIDDTEITYKDSFAELIPNMNLGNKYFKFDAKTKEVNTKKLPPLIKTDLKVKESIKKEEYKNEDENYKGIKLIGKLDLDSLISNKKRRILIKKNLKVENNTFDKVTNFIPDFRDTILFNGKEIYYATGKIINDRIEFYKKGIQDELLYLNTNLSAEDYINCHDQFDLIRNKNLSDFSNQAVVIPKNKKNITYLPTGRIFRRNNGLVLKEIMRENEPDDMAYFGGVICKSGEDIIEGESALRFDVIPNSEFDILTNENIDEWNITVNLAVNAKRAGKNDEALKIWKYFENKYPGLNPRLSSGKGKVLILLDRLVEAKNEFLERIKYFIRFESELLESNDESLINGCLASIEHIGYCVDKWKDTLEYIDGIAGKGLNTNKYYINKRTLKGLNVIMGEGLWCDTFNQIKSNIETKIG